jgi:hypothetical protein
MERDGICPVRRGHRTRQRRSETPETYVVWLITQRSRVQIPPPLPRPEAGSEQGSGLLLVFCARICAREPAQAAPSLVASAWSAIASEASEPPMISCASVLATWRSASRSAWTYCFMVNATSACPIRLLRAFKAAPAAPRPASAPGSALGGPPAHAGPHRTTARSTRLTRHADQCVPSRLASPLIVQLAVLAFA